MDYDAIVIGAGMGGLSAGATLAAGGLRTLVLEQADYVGGCATSFDADGFRFDVGACIVEMVRAHRWLYRKLGLDMGDYITFLPNDPIYEFVDIFSGEHVLIPASFEGMAEIIGRHSVEDAEAYLRFMRGPGRTVDEFVDVVFTTPQGRMRDMVKTFGKYPRILSNMRYIMTPYKKLVDDLFHHPYTKRLLCHGAAVGGLPTNRQSAMLLWQCYAEHDGMFYPKGGMGELGRAMGRALKDLGGELRVGSRVDRVILERGRAGGVVLDDGSVLTSRAVVSNANARTLYLDMVGEDRLPRAVVKGLNSYRFSPSCTVGYLGLDYRPPLKAQHMFGLGSPELNDGYWESFYEKNIPVAYSVGLVSSPSYMDPDLAPKGHHNLAFMNVAPRHPRGSTWGNIKWDYLEQGIDALDAFYLPGVKQHVVFKTIATPEDFERRLLNPNGSIYAFSMSMLSQMLFRPGNRSRCVKNLYLCGASSHTGSVPGATCSGVLAAELVLDDLDGREKP